MKPKNRVWKGRGEFNKYVLEPGAINFKSFSPEVHLWRAESIPEVFPKLGPWPCSRTLSLHSLPLSPADFQPSLGGCAYRCNNLTGDLDKTPFLTQRADNFKGTLLLPLHRRNLPPKDISARDSGGFRGWQGLSTRGRDSAWQLCEHGKELEGKYEEKMNLFSTKHVYFNFFEASEKSLSKTPGYKSKWERERKRASERKPLLWLAMKDYSGSITVFT